MNEGRLATTNVAMPALGRGRRYSPTGPAHAFW